MHPEASIYDDPLDRIWLRTVLELVMYGLLRLRPMSYEIALAPQRPIRTSTEFHVLPRQCTCTDTP